jgi:hypothetical protein
MPSLARDEGLSGSLPLNTCLERFLLINSQYSQSKNNLPTNSQSSQRALKCSVRSRKSSTELIKRTSYVRNLERCWTPAASEKYSPQKVISPFSKRHGMTSLAQLSGQMSH